MTNNPFFSVVVPVYNRADLILKTLSSIFAQSFRDFEIIIIDDGSTDNLEVKLAPTIEGENRLKYIRQENKERGAARNNGFRNATGMYVVFFDSDDLMHKDHLEVLQKNILEQQYPDFIASKFDFVDENGKHTSSDINKIDQGYYNYRLFLDGNPLACNICVKRENQSLKLFEEDREFAIKEDWLFMLMNLREQKLFIVDKVTISMSDHPERSMRSDNEKIIRKTKLAHRWILNNINLNDAEKNQLSAHVNYFCGIHSYLENNKSDAMSYALNAVKSGGIKIKYVSLFLKSILGKNIIGKLK